MNRDDMITTLNLQGWEPCAINSMGSPLQGITCGDIFYFAQDIVMSRNSPRTPGRTFGYTRFVDVTTALQRDWGDFDDIDLGVLYRQAQVYMEVGHGGP